MKRVLVSLGMVLALVGFARPVQAQPPVTADVLGIELCPQSICGAAVFYGAIHVNTGSENGRAGTILGLIQHDELPEAGQTAALTNGVLRLQFDEEIIDLLLAVGNLTNNDDGTYTIAALFSDGEMLHFFSGVLDHNFFPPLVYGTLTPLIIPD